MDFIDGTLSSLRANTWLSNAITIGLVLYSSIAAPTLPPHIAEVFDNAGFKFIVLLLVLALLRSQNTVVAVLLAIAFMMSYGTLSTYKTLGAVHDVASAALSAEEAMPIETPEKVTPGPISMVDWDSKNGINKIQLRGQVYESRDIKNLLPGGHGNEDIEGF